MRLSCVSNDAASAVCTRALASKYAMRPIALHESPMLPCLWQQCQSMRFLEHEYSQRKSTLSVWTICRLIADFGAYGKPVVSPGPYQISLVHCGPPPCIAVHFCAGEEEPAALPASCAHATTHRQDTERCYRRYVCQCYFKVLSMNPSEYNRWTAKREVDRTPTVYQ